MIPAQGLMRGTVLAARLAATSRISRTSPLRAAATTHSLRSALRMTDKAEAEEAKAPASTGGTFEFYTRYSFCHPLDSRQPTLMHSFWQL